MVPARPRPLANLWVASVVLFFLFLTSSSCLFFSFLLGRFPFRCGFFYSCCFFLRFFPIHWLSAPPVRLDRPLSVARDAGRHDVTA